MVISKKEQILFLEEQISSKKEMMQYLRTLIASAAMSGRQDLVEKKEEELSMIKEEIEELELQISKMKSGK